MKKLWFPNETDCEVEDSLGVWDGNAIKFGCDDHCTTINVIKFIELKKNPLFSKPEKAPRSPEAKKHICLYLSDLFHLV